MYLSVELCRRLVQRPQRLRPHLVQLSRLKLDSKRRLVIKALQRLCSAHLRALLYRDEGSELRPFGREGLASRFHALLPFLPLELLFVPFVGVLQLRVLLLHFGLLPLEFSDLAL